MEPIPKTLRWVCRLVAALLLVALVPGNALAQLKDGTLDPQFGSDGTVLPGLSEGRAVAIQPNGRIVVAGATVQNRFGVARFLPDGSIDPTFGGGDGEAVVWFKMPPNGCFGGFNDVTLQPDGKVVAVGVACGEVGIARFLPDGRLDPAFGVGGTVRTPVSQKGVDAEANAVTLQPDGRIVVAGSQPGPQSNVAIVRYLPDGSLDPTFHGDGTLISDVPGSGYATDVVVDSSDRIWIAGIESDVTPSSEPAAMVARYLPKGRLDPAFGDGGVVQLPGETVSVQAALALETGGRAIVAATVVKDFQVARILDDGSLDPSFNDDGTVTTNLSPGCCDRPLDVALQADGKVVVLAASTSGGGHEDLLGLVRYTDAGRLDATFGDQGKVRTSFADPAASIFAGGLGIAPNGDLVASGESLEHGRSVALMARYVSRS